MYRAIKATVNKETSAGTLFHVLVPGESLTDEMKKLTNKGMLTGELRIDDGRRITADQRKKIYATLADMASHIGYLPEEWKELAKYYFIARTGSPYISFSDCSITTARNFINFILDFALEHGIPLSDLAVNRTDDINAYLYSCLMHKRCCVCGGKAEIHHEDAVGMGRRRKDIIHLGMRVMALCRKHHTEAHTIGKAAFNAKYHVYGLAADKRICERWGLNH